MPVPRRTPEPPRMPSMTCPTCGPVVPVEDPFDGEPNCPRCHWRIPVGNPVGITPVRPRVEVRVQADAPSSRSGQELAPPRPSLPLGVPEACVLWIVCGYFGLLLSGVPLLVYFLCPTPVFYSSMTSISVGSILLFVLLLLGGLFALILYRRAIQVGRAILQRRQPTLHRVAWIGLVLAVVLLWCIVGLMAIVQIATSQSPPRSLRDPVFRMARDEPRPVHLPVPGGILVTLGLVNLGLIAGAYCFLWHSGDYDRPQTQLTDPTGAIAVRALPDSIQFAGRVWFWIAGVSIGLALVEATEIYAGVYGPAYGREPSFCFLVFLVMVNTPALLTLPLGILLQCGRLPGTVGVSVLFLAFTVLGIVATALVYSQPGVRATLPPGRPTLLEWVLWLGVNGASLAAAIAGMVGDREYRDWLRARHRAGTPRL